MRGRTRERIRETPERDLDFTLNGVLCIALIVAVVLPFLLLGDDLFPHGPIIYTAMYLILIIQLMLAGLSLILYNPGISTSGGCSITIIPDHRIEKEKHWNKRDGETNLVSLNFSILFETGAIFGVIWYTSEGFIFGAIFALIAAVYLFFTVEYHWQRFRHFHGMERRICQKDTERTIKLVRRGLSANGISYTMLSRSGRLPIRDLDHRIIHPGFSKFERTYTYREIFLIGDGVLHIRILVTLGTVRQYGWSVVEIGPRNVETLEFMRKIQGILDDVFGGGKYSREMSERNSEEDDRDRQQ